MTFSGRLTVVTLVAGLLGALGCAHEPQPPRELVEARAAYGRAAHGPAQELAPARLELARQALTAAEQSYKKAPEGAEVRYRAYLAVRRAEAAEVEAEADQAGQRRERALRELARLSGRHAERARAELGAAGIHIKPAEPVMSDSERAERQARAQTETLAKQAMAELQRQSNVKRDTRGLVVTLPGQALFLPDQATLAQTAPASLKGLADALKGMPPETKVTIESHTDASGQRLYDLDLSRKQAQAVFEYLISQGVPGDLLITQGLGPDRPVVRTGSPADRASNRRVEIVIPGAATVAQQGGSTGVDTTAPVTGTVGNFNLNSISSGASSGPAVPTTPGTPRASAAPSAGTTATGTATTGTTSSTSTGNFSTSSGNFGTAPSTSPAMPAPTTTTPSGPITPPPLPGTSTPPPVPGTSTPPASPGTSTPPPSPGTSTPLLPAPGGTR